MIDERWAEAAHSLRSDADFWSLRIVDERTDEHGAAMTSPNRPGVPDPVV
ncbi:MAG: hypothetical protein VB137_02100 [Burkholderia sp.]